MKMIALALFAASALHAAEPEDWWAFKPLKKAAVPQPKNAVWARNDIDLFILAAIEAKGLLPSPDADQPTLLRRMSFDLTGLPPSPEKLAEVVARKSPDRADSIRDRQAMADSLLALPQFGERWGRHWLDVARYAETSGRDENVTFPNAWRYRDYVIAALNADKPYDRFITEQIAGDLLPAANDAERAQHLIATGFLAVGSKSLNDRNPRQFAVDLADEQVSAVGEAALGMTLGCARCHDHKFDPFTQRDYTALAGIFLSTDTRYGTPGGVQGRNLGALIELTPSAALPVVARPLPREEIDRKKSRRDSERAELRRIMADRAPDNPNRNAATGTMSAFDVVRIFTHVAQLDAELANYDDSGSPKTLAMGALDKPVTAPPRRGPGGMRGPGGPGMGRPGGQRTSGFDIIADAPLFARGDILKERDPVPRGMPALLGAAPAIPAGKSGRLELAQWLTSEKNPLTARVMVNRVWAWLFGRGLVASLDNFGTSGDLPTHPELLDYLAAKFIADGWSVKKLVREIVTSRTYGQSAYIFPGNQAEVIDPDNTLLWRHTPRRLDAECVRDAMLAASGELDLAPKPGSVIARAGDGPIGGPRNRAMSEEEVAKADSNTRSIFLPVARNIPHEMLAVFDFPDGAAVHGQREITNVPTQSLFLMNSAFVERQSRALAVRVLAARKDFDSRFDLMCLLVRGNAASPQEHQITRAFLDREKQRAVEYKRPSDEASLWTGVARSIFSSAEFRMVN